MSEPDGGMFPPPRHRFWDVVAADGPLAGQLIPIHGQPRYGFCLELERFVPGAWNRRPQTFIEIYKIADDPRTARHVGTLR